MLASSWLSPTKLGLSCQVAGASASAKFITGELQGTSISTTQTTAWPSGLAPQVPPEFWHGTITTSVPNLNMDHWWQECQKYQRPTNHRVNDKTPWFQETILLCWPSVTVLLKVSFQSSFYNKCLLTKAKAWKYKSEELTSSPIWKYKSPSKVKVVWEDRAWDLIKLNKFISFVLDKMPAKYASAL